VPRTRHLRLGVVALAIALLAALAPTLPNRSIPPAGEVRGAVASPAPDAGPADQARLDPVPVYPRATDREGPPAGRELLPPQPGELTGYVWPLARGRISLPFKAIPGGSRIKDGKLWHDGLDMASFCGDHVMAAHDGKVLAAGRRYDEFVGWVGSLRPYYKLLDKKQMWNDLPIVVVIDDGNGYRSIYAHFSKVMVAAGDAVRAGDVIGLEGRTGHASGCHVHYGLFSPLETRTFGVRADILKRLRVPAAEIARIDPIQVLPGGAEALRTRRIPGPATSPSTPSAAEDRTREHASPQ
jgi:murein DD-endopeptidase MepM/ murein hydrolase activator NlpD